VALHPFRANAVGVFESARRVLADGLGAVDLLEGPELELPASAGDMEELAVLEEDQAAGTDWFGTGRAGRVGRLTVGGGHGLRYG
jgi:hypothetical protein